MNEDLERLFAADEEGRARLAAARAQASQAVAAARQALQQARETERRNLQEALERELAGIRADGARTVEERGRRRAEFLAQRRIASQALLSRAVEAFVRVVRDGGRGER